MPGFIADVMSATLAAQIGVLPLTVLYFNNVSLISIVSNVLVIPVVEVITVLGSVMAIVGQISIVFSQIIGYINSPFLTFVLFATKATSSVPHAVLRVVTPPLLLVFAYYAAVLFFMWYKPLKKIKVKPTYYFIALAAIIIVFGINYLTPKKLEAVFVDVGEGDCSLVRTYTGKTILIDGGGYNSRLNPGSNIGDTVVIPFLLDYGVSGLDMVIATHGHDDHIQGLEAVLKNFNVKKLVIPDIADKTAFEKLLNICSEKNIKTDVCQEGNIIRLDDQTSLDVLYPQKGLKRDDTLNNYSLVLKLHYKNNSILFTGDIQSEVEKQLLADGDDLHADVLKVAHHGSPYSTTSDFLKAVNPVAAIISVGKNNFGHPAPSTIDRLNQGNVKVYRTDECGAVILTSDGEKMTIKRTIEN
jgi:competence protein ComEC